MSKLISTNPARNYEPVGEVAISTEEEIVKKVAAANQAKAAWRATDVKDRIVLVSEVLELLKAQKGDIADLITEEVGKTISNAHGEMEYYLNYVEWCLQNVERALLPEVLDDAPEYTGQVEYEPWGTVAVISPWNFPFGMAMWGIIPNLLVGNTVVFKTSEECPLIGVLLEETFGKVAFPKGVFSVVHGGGKVGDFLTDQYINMIWFTGSTKTGHHLYQKAGQKFIPALMELGGSSPAIVFEDAPLENVLDVLFAGRFRHCGQVCTAIKRVIVHESIYYDVVAGLRTKLDEITIGDPTSPDNFLGPLTAKRQQELALEQIADAKDKGAELYYGPSVDGLPGAYVSPVLVTEVQSDMRVWQEETFAPILPVVPFSDEAEAIALANDTNYGLTAQVFTADSERGMRVARAIEAGGLKVGVVAPPLSHELPFGGYKDSGMGREHGVIGMRQLCQMKAILKSK